MKSFVDDEHDLVRKVSLEGLNHALDRGFEIDKLDGVTLNLSVRLHQDSSRLLAVEDDVSDLEIRLGNRGDVGVELGSVLIISRRLVDL